MNKLLMMKPCGIPLTKSCAIYKMLEPADGQTITDSGAPYYWVFESGVWVKKARRGVNLLLPNQASAEDGTLVGVTGNTATTSVYNSTEKARTGTRVFKVIGDGTQANQGIAIGTSSSIVPVLPGKVVHYSSYVAGLNGGEEVNIFVGEYDANKNYLRGSSSSLVAMSTDFTRLTHSRTVGNDCRFTTMNVLAKANTAMTFYVDDSQIEYDQLTDFEMPRLHGYNGSTLAVDANDGTWTSAGLQFGANDYGSLLSMPPAEAVSRTPGDPEQKRFVRPPHSRWTG